MLNFNYVLLTKYTLSAIKDLVLLEICVFLKQYTDLHPFSCWVPMFLGHLHIAFHH